MRDACPLMIFAAGYGTRMGALTADRPKPMLEVAGRTLIDRAIDFGEAAGCGPVVANTHYLAEVIEPALSRRGVLISRETPTILDTGGGLKKALPLLGGEIIATLNPDVAWIGPNPLDVLRDAAWPAGAGALLLLVPGRHAHARSGPGDFDLRTDGRLVRGGDWVYTGVQLVRAEAVASVDDEVFSMNRVWDSLVAEGRLHGHVYPGAWCDVGHPGGLATAEALLRERA